MADFGRVWDRILACEGEEFHTKTGLPFRYRVDGNLVTPDRTKYPIHRSQFARAFELMPLGGPVEINELVRGPAYVFAILMDRRTRG